MKGFDTNRKVTARISCLKQNGMEFAMRYYSHPTTSPKNPSRAEAQALVNANLAIGAVWQELGNNAQSFSAAQGKVDGKRAFNMATKVIGQPRGTVIYFAVDFDASDSEVTNHIIPYFTNVRQTIKDLAGTPDQEFFRGVYGSGLVCRRLLEAGLVSHTWLSMSMGFRESRDFRNAKKYHVLQHLETTLCEISIDPDETNTEKDPGFYDSLAPLVP